MDQQNNTALLYSLIFDGLTDQSPETLQKLKGVFIADLDLTIPEVQRILNSSQSVICSGDELSDLELKSKKLQSVGALVTIVSNIEENADEPESELLEDNNSQAIGESEVELQFEDSDELEFEIELDEPKAPAKPKKAKVHKVEEVSLSDTLKELGIEEVNIADTTTENNISTSEENKLKLDAFVANFSFEEPAEGIKEAISLKEENEQIKEAIKNPQLFSDLTIQDVDTGLELVDELVKEDTTELLETEQKKAKRQDSATQNKTKDANNQEEDEFNLILEEEPKPGPELNIEAKPEKKVQNSIKLVPEIKESPQTRKVSTDKKVETETKIESKTESVEELQTQFLKAKEELLESIENSLNGDTEQRPTILLKEENVIKTTSNDSVAQIQNQTTVTIPSGSTKRKKKSFIVRNLDSIIAVIVGGVILGFANYFYFKEPESPKLSEQNVNKQIKQITKASNNEKVKTEIKTVAVLLKSEILEEGYSLKAEIQKNKKDLSLKKLEIQFAKPKPPTEAEIIAGKKVKSWLSKIVIENKILALNPEGAIDQEIPFKAYAIIKGQNVRYVGKAKLVGQLNTNPEELNLKVQIEQGISLPAENKISIEESSEEEINFSLNLSLSLK